MKRNLIFKRYYLIIIFLSFSLPLISLSSTFVPFSTKIDTIQERINVQVILNRVMVPSPGLVVDGVLGKKSIQAIQAFQESRGLVVDGKIGPITRLALENAQTGTSGTSSYTNTNTTTTTTTGCSSGALFNTQTGQPCTTNQSYSSGCEGNNKYNTLTGELCNTLIPTTSCSGSAYSSCSISNGQGIKSRTCNSGIWSSYGTCILTSCNNGYQVINNTCIVTTCSGSSSQSCTITNGTGIQSRTCTGGVWSSFSTCTPTSCNNGYQVNNNACALITITPPVCTPEPTSTTCLNKCGSQINNCGNSVSCGGCGGGGIGVAESILLADVPLIHDQTFLIPENSVSGDTVGDLNLMWIDPSQNILFSLVNNDGGRFSIQKLTGVNTVSNHRLNYEVRISVATANFDYDAQKQRQMTVRATDSSSGKYNDIVVVILLSKTENTFFVDPTWTGCETGTRVCPYNSWNDIVGDSYRGFASGRTYLQKRGTSTADRIYSYSSGTQTQHIVLGAYGSGNRPMLDGSSDSNIYSTGLYLGDGEVYVEYYDVYSLSFRGGYAGVITGRMGTSHCTLNDLYFSHTSGPGIYFSSNYTNGHSNIDRLYHKVIDSFSEYTGGFIDEYGYKTEASQVEFIYTVARFNELMGFSGGASELTFSYCQAYDSAWGIKAHGDDIIIDHTLIQDNAKVGIHLGNYYQLNYGLTNENFHLKDSLIKDNGEGIIVSQDAKNALIESTEFSGNPRAIGFYTDGAFIGAPSNFIIKNSKFHENNEGIYIGNGQSPYPSNITIAYNLFYDNTGNPVTITDGSDIKVYNNLFYSNAGSYDAQISRNELFTAKNNLLEDGIFASSISTHVMDHNINYQSSFSINTGLRDFHLVSGSSPINAGVNVGFAKDYDGKLILGNPDIGAFEY